MVFIDVNEGYFWVEFFENFFKIFNLWIVEFFLGISIYEVVVNYKKFWFR